MSGFLQRILLVILSGTLFCGCQTSTPSTLSTGQGLTVPSAPVDLSEDSVWMSMERDIQSTVEADGIPGAVLLLARNGEVIGHKAYGTSNPLSGEPMDKEALFRICSQTKAITSMAAMILWERGALGLDDPVSKYLPEFAHVGVLDTLLGDTIGVYSTPRTTLTIRHLMTHTCGIPYGDIGDDRFDRLYAKHKVVDLFPIDGRSTRDNVKLLARTGLVHHPGEQWTYGLGLDVLAAVVEVASGKPYAEFLRIELLDPLGMDHTHFVVPEEQRTGLANVFDKDSTGAWQLHEHPRYTTDYPTHEEWPLCSGGAGLTSTAMDYARFLQMVVDRGAIPGGRLLEESTIDTVLADHAPAHQDGDWHQGLAFAVQKKPEGQGRFFWGGYFNTHGFGDPATGEVLLLMKQTYGVNNDNSSAAFRSMLAR